jgi:hypothetical protein
MNVIAGAAAVLPTSEQRERRFFLAMALLLIATAILGFGYFQYAGISSWAEPWWMHAHAVVSMGWLGFFALQNALVVRGSVGLHRRLGLFGAGYAGLLVVVDVALSLFVIASGSGDGIFMPANLLALNMMNVLTFGALFLAGFRLRHRMDWHKRLMLSATIAVSGPAFGRILIMLDARTTLSFTLAILSYIVIGILFDLTEHKRLHPAYVWSFSAVVLMGLSIRVLPHFGPFAALARAVAG